MDNTFLASLALIIIGSTLIGTSVFGMHEFAYWRQHGTPTEAIIIDKYVQEECSNYNSCLDNHYLVYTFRTSKNKVINGKDSVNSTFWYRHEIESTVSLLYFDEPPYESSVSLAYGLNTKIILWKVMLAVGAFVVMIGIIILFKVFKSAKTPRP